MHEFQRALSAAFEAGPAGAIDLKIDRLDGHADAAKPVPACVGTLCAEPVLKTICLASRNESVRACLTVVAEPVAAAAG
ncbi:hypothetical protein [Amycolatopsis sp.]|uniref:hypothetical protein n=1 Tax=Amycolatopsis sp. TaxID=37632 RepID=UPI002D7F9152|nr:hypothetical protein [Amycolatopsis sp.]HET6706696.1 hypothetical protein [Amycolatopsis sp.]